MYERTETGEVIASVIKNGVPKPNSLGGGGVSAAASAATAAAVAVPRGRPSAVEPQRSYVAECTLPPDCPINEANVESVLDRSIAATQAMRRTLTNLKDDLRRMGGGPTVTPALRPIHMQHRVDVACKLANAFVDYRDLIARISNENHAANKVANNENAVPVKGGGSSAAPTTAASSSSATSSVALSGGNKQVSTPLPRSATARRKEQSAAAVAASSSPPVVGGRLPSRSELTSRRKAAAPASSAHKRKATTDVESIVSDDLWMSCEPCD